MLQPDCVVLAEILRTRGIAGEVVAYSQTDVPGRLESLKRAQVRIGDGLDVPVEIESAWPHKGLWVVKFTGVNSIEDAQRFCRGSLWVPLAERATLDEGDWFQSDLLGCVIVDESTGQPVGEVSGWQAFGGPPLMEVRAGDHTHLIPFVRELCAVDLANRTIRMTIPEGLLEL